MLLPQKNSFQITLKFFHQLSLGIYVAHKTQALWLQSDQMKYDELKSNLSSQNAK